MKRRFTRWFAAIALPILVAAPAGAVMITGPSMGITVTGMDGTSQSFDAMDLATLNALAGMSATMQTTINPDGTKTISGTMTMMDVWDFTWMLTTNLDPFVTLHTVITNTNSTDQVFGVAAGAPVFPPITPSSRMGGTLGGTVVDTNNDGSAHLLAPMGGGAIYEARIDGTGVQTMIPPGNGLTYSGAAGGFASFVIPPSFGMPGVTQPGPAVMSSIGIVNIFDLSAGDTATLDSYFEVLPVPEPASAGLVALALIGLAAARRRA